MAIFTYSSRKKFQIGFGLILAIAAIIAGNYTAEIDKALNIDFSSTVLTVLMWLGFALAAYGFITYIKQRIKSKARSLFTQAINTASKSLESQVTPQSNETKYKLRNDEQKPASYSTSTASAPKTATAPKAASKNCRYCGSSSDTASDNCPNCGAPL